MKIALLSFIVLTASAADFNSKQGKKVTSPLQSPKNQHVLNNIFPEYYFLPKIYRGSRIAGGEFAKLGQFPHQALILTTDSNGDDFVCGGSIISHNWILTAAHCLEEIASVSIYVGIIDRINGPAVWGLDVESQTDMIIHENFASSNLVNDIALIRLSTTIKSDPNVGIVSLPTRSEANILLDGKSATVAGFGRYTDTSGPSQFLRWVLSPIVPNENCEKVFGKANVLYTNICLDTAGGKSSCQGDSGGGLTVDLNGRKVLVGVVSYGARIGCTLGHPAVFTRVSKYLDWIQEKTSIKIF
ncbi:CLUMA_CG020836, isoform A [Clunio marinus]|uniref:CLUMA_CG020836, isoform A n=1 Tax=Clunio marinus TaxID=568069 RepID=A0A1J1J6Y9_9DIPT|nr:CLUMA_CG020836, isoform A [Clunio marinus]